MIANHKRKKRSGLWKRLFLSIFLWLALFSAIGFLALTNFKIRERRENLIVKNEALKKETGILEERNKELNEMLAQIGSKEYLEKIAREQFGLKAPGEEVVVISKEGEQSKEKKDAKPAGKETTETWWNEIKNFFNFWK